MADIKLMIADKQPISHYRSGAVGGGHQFMCAIYPV